MRRSFNPRPPMSWWAPLWLNPVQLAPIVDPGDAAAGGATPNGGPLGPLVDVSSPVHSVVAVSIVETTAPDSLVAASAVDPGSEVQVGLNSPSMVMFDLATEDPMQPSPTMETAPCIAPPPPATSPCVLTGVPATSALAGAASTLAGAPCIEAVPVCAAVASWTFDRDADTCARWCYLYFGGCAEYRGSISMRRGGSDAGAHNVYPCACCCHLYFGRRAKY